MNAIPSVGEIASIYKETKDYLDVLHQRGWLDRTDFSIGDSKAATDLFAPEVAGRPLVVGLFGGTGVGKSSLLNRLAGSNIAKTGVVRPTSLAITAYMHESRDIDSLPAGFSATHLSSVKHQNQVFEDVLWVDMPDFDSDETTNREQVLQWIPYIDLLIYVVTPERYKDEQGWRLLMSEGYRHGWLFLMNQWDRAEAVQMEDFIRLLTQSGFAQPKVFKTLGIERSVEADEFDKLVELVTSLAERNVVEQLEQVGWFRRLEAAQHQLQEPLKMLASPPEGLLDLFDRRWAGIGESVAANLRVPFNEFATKFSDSAELPIRNALRAVTGGQDNSKKFEYSALAREADTLWDKWSQVRLSDAITEFELAREEHGVPVQRLIALRSEVGEFGFDKSIGQSWNDEVTEAFMKPGPEWQRMLQTVLGVAKVVLPIAAVLWVAIRIITGFIDGASNADAYVGTDIIANGALLVFIAWFLPWVAAYFSRPSVPKAVVTSLTHQLEHDLTESVESYRVGLQSLASERIELNQNAVELQKRIQSVLSRSSVLTGEDVRDLLMHKPG